VGMNQNLLSANAKPAMLVIKWQSGLAILVIALASYWGKIECYSAALGVIVSLVGSVYFIWQSFRKGNTTKPELMLKRFYRGFFGKIALVLCGFVLVYKFVNPLSPNALFLGFVLMQISMCVELILVAKN